MKFKSFFSVAWPSMLGACLIEMLVFAMIDPSQIPTMASATGLSVQGIYSLSFFVFWAAIGVACAMTLQLVQPAETAPQAS